MSMNLLCPEQASIRDVDISVNEIKDTRALAELQLQNVKDVQGDFE